MHRNPTTPAARLAIAISLLAFATHCLAVDPPPPGLLKASKEDQLRYVQKTGADSERLRAKVARRRFEEKKEIKQAFAAGVAREVEIQRELMTAAGGSGDRVTDLAAASGEVAGGNYLIWTVAGLAALGFYHFRDKLFSLFEKNT